MKSQFEVYFDVDTIAVDVAGVIRRHHEKGQRIIWNNKGQRGVVPPAVLDQTYSLLDDYAKRLRPYDTVPPDVGLLHWESVVPIPTHGAVSHGRPDDDTDT